MMLRWTHALIAVGWCIAGIVVSAQSQVPQDETLVNLSAPASAERPPKTLIVVTGAGGEAEFSKAFAASTARWLEFAKQQQWEVTSIGTSESHSEIAVEAKFSSSQSPSPVPPSPVSSSIESANPDLLADRDSLRQAIAKRGALPEEAELWIVLIGHGTFAANVAKFNLVGPDVAASELNDWLKPLRARVVVINCSSSSGPFVTALAATNRIVVTATRSGTEQNYSRFGNFLSEAISSRSADVDHDLEISLLEAFLAASSQTERFYREDARLATEHALLDDNGDRMGTGSDFYRGVRPIKESEPGKQIDGRAASRAILFSSPEAPKLTSAQLAERQQIEEQIDALRTRKSQLTESEYLDQLEVLCLELAHVYRAAKG